VPKKVKFQIKMGWNGRATKITYEIRKKNIYIFYLQKTMRSHAAFFTPFNVDH